jgi:hypothetical protein
MEGFAFLVLFFTMLITLASGLIILSIRNVRSVKEQDLRELREAEAAYRSSLADLKASPMNADLKEDVLRKGRVYSNLTRRRRGVTVHDEVALMNDISAACAGAPQVARNGGTKSLEDRLASMQQLKEKSLITEQEYEQRRAEILKEL